MLIKELIKELKLAEKQKMNEVIFSTPDNYFNELVDLNPCDWPHEKTLVLHLG